MSALPPIRRFNKEDFPEAPPWMDKFLYPLNQFIEAVYGALSNLNFGPNVLAQIKTLTFQTPGGVLTPTPLKFAKTLKAKAQGVIILTISQEDDPENAVGTALNWEELDGEIVINDIAGLLDDKKFTATFLVI